MLPSEDAERARRQLDSYTHAYYGAPIETMEKLQAFVAGPPEHCLARLREYVGAGAEHIVVRVGALDPTEHLEPVAELAKALTKSAPPCR